MSTHKQKKHDRAWFEQKVSELGKEIEQLPDERQLELFKQLEKSEGIPGGRKERNQKESA